MISLITRISFFIYVVFYLMLAFNGQSQPKTHSITGTVRSSFNNEKLEGVSVRVGNSDNGAFTDKNGVFQLSGIGSLDSIHFSSIGFKDIIINVGNENVVNVSMEPSISSLDQLVVVGYGTMKKKDLTGSIYEISGGDYKTQSTTQVTDLLAGTVAGFNSNQNTGPGGGGSMEIRGRTSLSAATNPLIVVDDAIFQGDISDINPYDIASINVLKDASSAAIYGAKAASGVVIITTKKGRTGRPKIDFSTKIGFQEVNNKRKGLGPKEFIQYRQDFLRQLDKDENYDFYTNPNNLPSNLTIEEWRSMDPNALDDNIQEWMARLKLFTVEQKNYLQGKTINPFDAEFRKGIQQQYDLGVSGGTQDVKYYWSLGYDKNRGIIYGQEYGKIRSRLNLDFKITDWFSAGINAQFSSFNDDKTPVAGTNSFYIISPYGQWFDDDGNLMRYPMGESQGTPLLDYYRISKLSKNNSLFSNIHTQATLPFGLKLKISFQPYFSDVKDFRFTTIDKKLGGNENELPSGSRSSSSSMNWEMDNILTWNKTFGVHALDLTFLFNLEQNQFWSQIMTNEDFAPNQELIYHGIQFGNSPTISSNDTKSTGDALMTRLNYSLLEKYLLTLSLRRDGFSAFGEKHPRAYFPSAAVAWVISDEKFFHSEAIDRLKFRTSWGANGNRDIGIYSALARMSSDNWFDGSVPIVGVSTNSIENVDLEWERTQAFNLGLDLTAFNDNLTVSLDAYQMITTNLLMDRTLPIITGFTNVTTNLGQVNNKGIELTISSKNFDREGFSWRSDFNLSLNRNEIKKLFGDKGEYTLNGVQKEGELPDFDNKWFPGQAIDVVWDYKVEGIWQLDEREEASVYGMQPGDFKSVDFDNDGKYIDVNDKRFIGYTVPRLRLGLRNDFNFFKNLNLSIFLRADLGHLRSYSDALNSGFESNDRRNRNYGPEPYWTKDRPNNEYARLNVNTGGYGGGLMIYKPSGFFRVQNVSLSYDLPDEWIKRARFLHFSVFTSVRNLATITNYPGWDPESGMAPMPREFTFGIDLSL